MTNIKEIADIAHKNGSFFMSDATQAFGKIELSVYEQDIDLMPVSSHKIYGPKGVGALFVRQKRPRKLRFEALQHGGGHERGLRSGTLNVPGIVGFGEACRLAKIEMKANSEKILKLRDKVEAELLKIPGTKVNGDFRNRIFSTSNICIPGVDSDALIMGLSENGSSLLTPIAISNGSACTAESIDPSHVLMAMGLTEEDAFCSIRISIGKYNTVEEIDYFIAQVRNVVDDLKHLTKSRVNSA